MLKEVLKDFDIDGGVTVTPGDIVEVSAWKNARALELAGFIGDTDKTEVTVKPNKQKKVQKDLDAPTKPLAGVLRRSALAGRPRVFKTR